MRGPLPASAGRHRHERRRHDRAGARGRGRRHDLRLQRRRDPSDLRRDLPLQRDAPRAEHPPRRARHRAGRRLHGGGLCAVERPRRRVSRHVGSRRDQLRHADPRLSGRFDPHGAHHGPGAARGDGHRRVPGSARLQHHGGLREARLPGHRRDEGRGDDADRLRHRAQRPARAGRRRHSARRAAEPGRIPGRRAAAAARLPRAPRRGDQGQAVGRRRRRVLRAAGRIGAPADLRRRRHHQQQRGARAARVREALRHSGRDDAPRHRRDGHDERAVAPHARHARRGLRKLRRRGLRLPVRGRLAVRRSRRRQGEGVRAGGEDRAPRHRRVRDRQGEARRLGARRRRQAWPDAADRGGG